MNDSCHHVTKNQTAQEPDEEERGRLAKSVKVRTDKVFHACGYVGCGVIRAVRARVFVILCVCRLCVSTFALLRCDCSPLYEERIDECIKIC
jgi:hypothetical protein